MLARFCWVLRHDSLWGGATPLEAAARYSTMRPIPIGFFFYGTFTCQIHYCDLGGNPHCFGALRDFRYLRDSLFLGSCLLYVVNRWAVKPLVPHGFFAWWFNDLLLIPCAAPVCLWIERKAGLRKHDRPPTAGEVVFLLVLWSVLFEVIAPRFLTRATGDWRDVLAYTVGAAAAWAWWNRCSWRNCTR